MTSIIDKPLKRFRTSPIRGGTPKVDREGGHFGAGLISGVSVITRGEALGHGQWIDQSAVESVATFGAKTRNGIKSRFTHPGLSADGMGTLLGRFKNFRVDGERAVADLHFQKSAHNTPDGDLAKYVMDLADEDPEAFGTSIVFDHDYGEEERFATANEDEDGYFRSPDNGNPNNYPHIRLAKLWADDVVDDPAANPGGLFRKGHEIAEEADRLCEFALGLTSERPTLQHLSVDAERLAGFAARFLESHQLKLEKKDMTTPAAPAPVALTTESLNATLDAFGTSLLAQVDAKLAALKPQEIKPSDVELERKRCSELFATSKNAGLTDFEKVAQEAIDKNLSVDAFKASITDRLISQNGLSRDTGEVAGNPDAKYRKEYQQNRSAYAQMGLTEKEFIIGCKVENGSELLAYVPKEDKEAA